MSIQIIKAKIDIFAVDLPAVRQIKQMWKKQANKIVKYAFRFFAPAKRLTYLLFMNT